MANFWWLSSAFLGGLFIGSWLTLRLAVYIIVNQAFDRGFTRSEVLAVVGRLR
jgi:hypothetical protein